MLLIINAISIQDANTLRMWVRTARGDGDGDAGGPAAEDPVANCLDGSEVTAETLLSDLGNSDEERASSPPLFPKHAEETYFCTPGGIVEKDSIQEQERQAVNDGELREETPSNLSVEKACIDAANMESASTERGIPCKDATASENQQQGRARPKRKVHFSTVQIRDYGMTLGDNPACSYGPPVSLDWDYHQYEALDVNEYEFYRAPLRNQRKLGIDCRRRKALLSNAGFSEVDFARSRREVGRAKRGRTVSRRLTACCPLRKAEEAVESARWKFKRLVKNGLSRSSAGNPSASTR